MSDSSVTWYSISGIAEGKYPPPSYLSGHTTGVVLSLTVCICSQEAFMEQYFASQRDSIFKHVEVSVKTRYLVSVLYYTSLFAPPL